MELGGLDGVLSETVVHYLFETSDASTSFSFPSSTSFKTPPHRSEIVPSAAWFARAVITSLCTLSISCFTLSRVARRILTVASSCLSHQHSLFFGGGGGGGGGYYLAELGFFVGGGHGVGRELASSLPKCGFGLSTHDARLNFFLFDSVDAVRDAGDRSP
jgi:hypothetical protein